MARRFLKVEIKDLSYVPDGPNVSRAVRRQGTLLTAFPNNPAAKGIEALAERLMHEEVAPEPHSGVFGFVRRLARGKDSAPAL